MLPTLITIALLHWAILILPGFNFILVGQLAASGQRTTAMFAVAGMTTATLVWACLAVAGVGIVFTAHPQVRLVAQLAGVFICCTWPGSCGAQGRLRPRRRRWSWARRRRFGWGFSPVR